MQGPGTFFTLMILLFAAAWGYTMHGLSFMGVIGVTVAVLAIALMTS